MQNQVYHEGSFYPIPTAGATHATPTLTPAVLPFPARYDDCPVCDGAGTTQVPCYQAGWDEVECSRCFGSGYGDRGLIMRHLLQAPADVSDWVEG